MLRKRGTEGRSKRTARNVDTSGSDYDDIIEAEMVTMATTEFNNKTLGSRHDKAVKENPTIEGTAASMSSPGKSTEGDLNPVPRKAKDNYVHLDHSTKNDPRPPTIYNRLVGKMFRKSFEVAPEEPVDSANDVHTYCNSSLVRPRLPTPPSSSFSENNAYQV